MRTLTIPVPAATRDRLIALQRQQQFAQQLASQVIDTVLDLGGHAVPAGAPWQLQGDTLVFALPEPPTAPAAPPSEPPIDPPTPRPVTPEPMELRFTGGPVTDEYIPVEG